MYYTWYLTSQKKSCNHVFPIWIASKNRISLPIIDDRYLTMFHHRDSNGLLVCYTRDFSAFNGDKILKKSNSFRVMPFPPRLTRLIAPSDTVASKSTSKQYNILRISIHYKDLSDVTCYINGGACYICKCNSYIKL